MQNITPDEALQKARNLCSKQEKCKSDIATKLRQWNIEEDDIESITEKLVEQKYIDENRYAEYFVNSKIRISKWGKNKVAYALNGKQIPDSYIQNALAQFDEDEYREIVVGEIRKKARTVRYKSKTDLQRKLFSFCQSRGYEPYIFNNVISL